MSGLSFVFVFSCLLALVLSQTPVLLQFSHQAPYTPVLVDLLVNGHQLPAFSDIAYGDISPFADISEYSQDPENPSSFNLTLIVSDTRAVVDSQEWDLSLEYPSSYFVLNSVGGGEVFPSVVVDQFEKPEQYNILWRFANFAPVDTEFQIYINSVANPSEYMEISAYAPDVAGDYTFTVVSSNGTVADITVSLSSGQVASVLFNGNSQFGPTSYALEAHVDRSYAYDSCRVRVVPAVASDSADNLTVVVVSTENQQTLVTGAEYSDVTAYQDVLLGSYTAFFTQNGQLVSETPKTDFECTDSASFSLTYQGTPTTLSASSIADASKVPTYQYLWLQFVHLVASPAASPAVLYLNGERRGTVSFPDTTGYLVVESTPVNLTVTTPSGDELYSTELTDVEMAASYSFYLLGLAGSDDYPVTGFLETDLSGNVTPSTTDSTTTEEDDGDDDEDDDDDDDLSGGAIAGIVIGVLIGVALIGFLIFFVVRRQRRSQFSTIG